MLLLELGLKEMGTLSSFEKEGALDWSHALIVLFLYTFSSQMVGRNALWN